MKAIGKITAKVVLGDLLKNKLEPDQRFETMRIAGRVDKVIVKPSSLNPDNIDVKLIGEFIATNVATGEQFTSGSLYPMGSGMTDLMSRAEVGSMFALSVFLQYSAKTVQGYSFDFESVLEMKPSDAIAQLQNAFKPLALGAPKEKQETHYKMDAPKETNSKKSK